MNLKDPRIRGLLSDCCNKPVSPTVLRGRDLNHHVFLYSGQKMILERDAAHGHYRPSGTRPESRRITYHLQAAHQEKGGGLKRPSCGVRRPPLLCLLFAFSSSRLPSAPGPAHSQNP